VWVKPSVLNRSTVVRELNLWARVEGSGGSNRHLLVGDLMESQPNPSGSDFLMFQRAPEGGLTPPQPEIDWQFFQVPLQENVESLEPPIRLVAFFMSREAFTRLPPGSISLDDIMAIGPVNESGRERVTTLIEGFEGAAPWVVLPNEKSNICICWHIYTF